MYLAVIFIFVMNLRICEKSTTGHAGSDIDTDDNERWRLPGKHIHAYQTLAITVESHPASAFNTSFK